MRKVDYLCPKTCAKTPYLDNLNINYIFEKNTKKLDIQSHLKVFKNDMNTAIGNLCSLKGDNLYRLILDRIA